MKKEKLQAYYDQLAFDRDDWKKRNKFYNRVIENRMQLAILKGSTVLEIGCGTGDLLNSVSPGVGVGIDFSCNMIEIARQKYPHLAFYKANAIDFACDIDFDYIIMSDLLGCLWDVQKVLDNLKQLVCSKTKIIITNYNHMWEPVLRLGEKLRLKARQPLQNWLSANDIFNLLRLSGFEPIRIDRKLIFPKYFPFINTVLNKVLANLPIVNSLCLINFIVARPVVSCDHEYSVSIVIPAQNEKGNIENAILRTPKFGSHLEFIFVEGNSKDNTLEEMQRVKEKFPQLDIKVLKQNGKGKGNAVREAFDIAHGNILMILDADLTTPPEDLSKFYEALKNNMGELINGCRLVYPMEKQAMRSLNLLGNKFFGLLFSFLLGQPVKDTLCGTKALFKADYERIKANRNYFGDFDPFGDFDLLFGAAKLNLKITEIIVRYKKREYGSSQISRFRHGMLLLRMSFFAARKLKFNC